MRQAIRLGLAALLVCALCGTASALTVPVYMEVNLPGPVVVPGTVFDVVVRADTTQLQTMSGLPAGLETAGVRLKGTGSVFNVVDIVPGIDFTENVVEITPPYSGFSYPGVLLGLDLLALSGAMGPGVELATFTLEAAVPGITSLELVFWDEPNPPAGNGTFDNFVAWEDFFAVPPDPPEFIFLDEYVEFGQGQELVVYIPEPCSMGTMLLGGAVFGIVRRRKR